MGLGGAVGMFVDGACEVHPEGVSTNKNWISVSLSSLRIFLGRRHGGMNVNVKGMALFLPVLIHCALKTVCTHCWRPTFIQPVFITLVYAPCTHLCLKLLVVLPSFYNFQHVCPFSCLLHYFSDWHLEGAGDESERLQLCLKKFFILNHPVLLLLLLLSLPLSTVSFLSPFRPFISF